MASDHRFRVRLDDGRGVVADAVVAAPGVGYFRSVPDWSAGLPDGLCSHTCDLVRFHDFAGALVLIVGGRQSADQGWRHQAGRRRRRPPKSTFLGYGYHQGSVDAARKHAAEAGVSDRVSFEAATAKDYPGDGLRPDRLFDCLHDMGDPVGALAHARQALAPDGTIMLVEPFANDDIADNLNPIGRVFYSASTLICTPASLSQEVGRGLGARAGQARLQQVAAEAGLTRFRRATETPFNLVLEARP